MIWSDVGLYKFIKFRKIKNKIKKYYIQKLIVLYCCKYGIYNFIVYKINKLVTLESDE